MLIVGMSSSSGEGGSPSLGSSLAIFPGIKVSGFDAGGRVVHRQRLSHLLWLGYSLSVDL